MDINQRIILLIKELGISDYKFADKIGVRKQKVYNIINGKVKVSTDVI